MFDTILPVVVSKFNRICNKYNFQRLEMIKFIKENKPDDVINFCEKISLIYQIDFTIENADYIMNHYDEFCEECAEPYTAKDMDGGRCLSCGTMIC